MNARVSADPPRTPAPWPVLRAVADFSITLTGVSTVSYNATDDLFHLA